MSRRNKSNNKRNKTHFNPPQLEAKTNNQRDYIQSILVNDITLCSGPAGCGKSFIAAGIASEQLLRGNFDHVIVTRPLVCAGTKLGALPGEVHEKINPFLIPMQKNLKYFLGMAHYGHFVNENVVQFLPLETMRGETYKKTLMILDEAQNCTKEQITMFMTRIGERSKVLINGDVNQTDIRNQSGLSECMSKLSDLHGVGVCRLDYDDIQRNDIIAGVIRALE